MKLLPCKCGAPLNKIVVNTIDCAVDFGKKRVIVCTVCGKKVEGWITPYAGEDTAESKWYLANAVQDVVVPPTPQEPESCATCKFWMDFSNLPDGGACRRFPETVIDKQSSCWCGEWKAVKS